LNWKKQIKKIYPFFQPFSVTELFKWSLVNNPLFSCPGFKSGAGKKRIRNYMLNIRKWIPLLMLLITAAALAGVINLCKQPSCTGKNPETSTFEWIGLPSGSYLCI
jgi:hypothetical protein